MSKLNNIFTVDSHVMGEPLRIVTGGISYLKGKSVKEKKEYFRDKFDHIRKALILEPRGHDNMFGAILCEPTNPLADIGIFFIHSGGYLDMCGHGIIGAVTTIIELGIITKPYEKKVEVILETPAGLIIAYAEIEEDKVVNVIFDNVPSFVLYKDYSLNLPQIGTIIMDIAYGGNFFGIISAKELSLNINKNNFTKLLSYSMELKGIINNKINVFHPINKTNSTIDLIEVYEEVESSSKHYHSFVAFGNGQVDRSPCGSGTSALLAVQYAKNKICLNEDICNESIIGTKFSGKLIKETKVGNFDAVIPRIKSRAFITGIHHFIIDSNDFLRNGLSLNEYALVNQISYAK